MNNFRFKIFALSIFAFIHLLQWNVAAQPMPDQNIIDSLNHVLDSEDNDTQKINILFEIGDQLKYTQLDSALQYFEEAFVISKKTDSKKHIAKSNLYIGIVNYYKSNYDEAISYLANALENYNQIGDKAGVAISFMSIGNIYLYLGQYDKAIENYHNSLTNYDEINDLKGMSGIYNNLGNIYSDQGNYSQAIDYYTKSLQIAEKLENKDGISDCYTNIGIVYWNKGQYDKAISYVIKSLKIAEELNDKRGIAYCYGNLGNLYYDQGSNDKAVEYYQKSLELSMELGDQQSVSKCYLSIGNIYKEKMDFDKAFEYLIKALRINVELGNQLGMANAYENIGVLYRQKFNYKKSIEYYNKSLKIRTEIGDQNGLAMTNNSIANLYLLLSDSVATNKTEKILFVNKAINYGNIALTIAEKINALPTINNAANILMKAYKKLGKFKNAIHFAEIYITTRDSMFNEEKTRTLQEMSTKYETEKKEQQILIQESQLARKDIEIKQQKTVRNALIGGLGAFVIIIVLVIYAYIVKRKDNIKITKQKNLIEKQKEEITDSIKYAQRIQSAVLPPEELISESLPKHFVLFKPRDIVSGDFYWMKRINDYTVITAVDCTGHGVPGAFMSMLGVAFLNEVVRNNQDLYANEILNQLRKQIKTTLRQEGREGEAKDGMDMALCIIDHDNLKLQYSGAYNPLYLYRKNESKFELIEIKADRMPIGIYQKEKESFTNHEIKLQKDDCFYIFSDGYADQKGGPDNRKYMTKRFKELLLNIQGMSMAEQKQNLEKTMSLWMQNSNQVDDMLIIGVQV